MIVEQFLSLTHQTAQLFSIPGLDCLDRLIGNFGADPAQVVLGSLIPAVLGKRKGTVQIGKYFHCILGALQIPYQQIKITTGNDWIGGHQLAVKDHLHGNLAIGTALIHPAAT